MNLQTIVLFASWLILVQPDYELFSQEAGQQSPFTFSQEDKMEPEESPWKKLARKSENMSLDQLSEAISSHDATFSSIHTEYIGGSVHMGGQTRYEFMPVVADPRVGRMIRLLREMDTETAAQKSLDIFQQNLDKMRELTTFSDILNNGKSDDAQHSVTAAAFLCSQFCNKNQFDDCMLQWMTFQRSKHLHRATHMTSQELSMHNVQAWSAEKYLGPNPSAVLNLYYLALLKDGKTPEEIDRRFKEILDRYRATPLPTIEPWRLRDHQGELMILPVMDRLQGRLEGGNSSRRAVHLEIIQQVREVLVPPSAVKSAVTEASGQVKQAANQYLQDWLTLLQ